MTMEILKESFVSLYQREIEELGETGLLCALDAGRKWDVSGTSREGGSVIFPHAYVGKCGDQIAAAVHGCLDCGADQVLVLGVDHCVAEEKNQIKMRELSGEDLSMEPFRGVFQQLEGEFSLMSFKALWETEVKRRGIRSPRLIMRYPSFVDRSPETLPGIEELERIAKDSVVVATGDLHHHGLAYKMTKDDSLPMGLEAERSARKKIEESFQLLKSGNYGAFFDHTFAIKSDARDPLSVLRYLKGAQEATILDLRLIDTSDNFDGEFSPSWVATSLVSLN